MIMTLCLECDKDDLEDFSDYFYTEIEMVRQSVPSYAEHVLYRRA